MKEWSNNSLDNFIAGWYIDESICDELIDLFDNKLETYKGVVKLSDGLEKTDPSYKDSIESTFPEYGVNDTSDKYYQGLQNVLEEYLKKYFYANETSSFRMLTFPQIQKYPLNGGFHQWHCERSSSLHPGASRHLVYMTYLNDVEDGGETEFFYQKIKVKPEKGLTIIWPADWTHTHRGISSKTETKYIVTGWYNFVENV